MYHINYSPSYRVPITTALLSHFPQLQPLVRDGSLDDSDSLDSDSRYLGDAGAAMDVRARVRSGDYFVTLATELDQLAQALNTMRAPEATELERVVSELFYINANYNIVSK